MLKNIKCRLNKNEAFTLVELIVVMAIVFVLIAMLVPNLLGYISNSRDTANLAAAKAIYNAASTACVNEKAKTGAYPECGRLAELMEGEVGKPETVLVVVPEGISAGISYRSESGDVSVVGVCSNPTFSTGSDAQSLAFYVPALSGNAKEQLNPGTISFNITKSDSSSWQADDSLQGTLSEELLAGVNNTDG